MANYSYRRVPKDRHKWIACLRVVNPPTQAGAHWSEIHFTEPKAACVQANLRPHVSFVSSSGTSHWYLRNAGGSWVVEYGNGRTQEGEGEVAAKVLADALASNWIREAPAAVLVDDGGFQTVESKGGRRGRMQKGWK